MGGEWRGIVKSINASFPNVPQQNWATACCPNHASVSSECVVSQPAHRGRDRSRAGQGAARMINTNCAEDSWQLRCAAVVRTQFTIHHSLFSIPMRLENEIKKNLKGLGYGW